MSIEKHLELLGLKAKDKVTGFSGVITTISFDLYGCVQAVITPPTDKEKNIQDGQWFDVNRLDIVSTKPVMELPDFVGRDIAKDKGVIAHKLKGAAIKTIPK